jgi:hypothetical protein
MTVAAKRLERVQPEAAIQRAVFEHLGWRGVDGLFAFHPANGGWRSPVEAAIFQGLGVVAGVPDVVVICNGQVFALELKAEGRRPTSAQLAAQQAMRRAGAHVATACGIDAALDQLKLWGLIS